MPLYGDVPKESSGMAAMRCQIIVRFNEQLGSSNVRSQKPSPKQTWKKQRGILVWVLDFVFFLKHTSDDHRWAMASQRGVSVNSLSFIAHVWWPHSALTNMKQEPYVKYSSSKTRSLCLERTSQKWGMDAPLIGFQNGTWIIPTLRFFFFFFF